MRNVLQKLILLLSLTVFCLTAAYSGNGKIAGVIKDNSGKAVPGATVMLTGTRLGGFADLEGRYFVLNIPPGKYDVTVSAVGFNKRTIRGIEVKSDMTTDLNITIVESAVEVEGVVVEAQRKLVDKTLTSTRTTIGSDELSNTLPISSTYELLQTAPSVFKGFVRGSKQEQTKTIVEGVDISDEFYAAAADQTVLGSTLAYHGISRANESKQSLATNVNASSVAELTVNTGAVGADYVSATGGVINYSLKEGKGALGGRAYFRASAGKLKYVGPSVYNDVNLYYAERDTLFKKGLTDQSFLVKAKHYTFYDGKYEEGLPSYEGELSLNGSISEDLGFFLSVNMKDNPDSRLPNEKYRELNSQLKLNYNLSSSIKLTAFGTLNDRGKLFGWKNSSYNELFRFFLEGSPKTNRMSWVGSLKMAHFLSNNTYYEIQVSNKYDNQTRGFCDDNNDGIIQNDEDGDFLLFDNNDQINRYMDAADDNKFFTPNPAIDQVWLTTFTGQGGMTYALGKPAIFYDDYYYNVLNAKADFTSQVTFNHQLKGGVSFKLSEYNKEKRSASGSGGTGRSYEEERWNEKPIEFSVYASDRMEYAGLVINAGLRMDMWDPKAEDYSDFFNPFILKSTEYPSGTYNEKVPVRGKKIDPYWYFSPRLGVSHPISDKATIYFSFSKMFQPPPASNLYSNYNYFGPSRPTVLTLSRKPYYTTNYELGAQWEFISNLSLNINAYQRDIENYNNVQFIATPRPGVLPTAFEYYYVSFNAGYANARGIELEITTLPYDVAGIAKVSGRFSYTYSYVKGVSFVGGVNNPTNFVAANGDSAKYGPTLPFDDYQYYRKVEVNIGGSNSTLTGGYDREHKMSYTLFARFPYDITLTSIGTFASGFYWTKKFVDDRIIGRSLTSGPWNAQVDLRLEKAFNLTNKLRIALFADVKNLFDRENILAYDKSSTGEDLWELKGDPTGLAKRPVGRDGSLFYDIPREVYFGVTIDF